MSKKPHILVICSRNKKRSLTAERMYKNDQRLVVRSAGTSPRAIHRVTKQDITWADSILCMENKHRDMLQKTFGKSSLPTLWVADIEDEYEYMDLELVEMLQVEIERVIS